LSKTFSEELKEIRSQLILFIMKSSRYFCRILKKFEFASDFRKTPKYMKCHENPSNGIRVVPCGQNDRRAGLAKLTVPFYNFQKRLKTTEHHNETEIAQTSKSVSKVRLSVQYTSWLLYLFGKRDATVKNGTILLKKGHLFTLL
jgi:hypothetical protein